MRIQFWQRGDFRGGPAGIELEKWRLAGRINRGIAFELAESSVVSWRQVAFFLGHAILTAESRDPAGLVIVNSMVVVRHDRLLLLGDR
jgi:hypothetical protein